MKTKLNFIDVTIREGSNLDWKVDIVQVIKLIKFFKYTKIDFLEIWYFNKKWNNFLSKFDSNYLKLVFNELKESNIKISLMWNLDKIDFNILDKLKDYNIWLLRFAYNKTDINYLLKLKKYIWALKENNVKLSINITRINEYTLDELKDLLNILQKYNFDILYIADTDWKLFPNILKEYLLIIKENFSWEIWIHLHDHSWLAMTNCLVWIENWVKYIDFSILGFWKWMTNIKSEKFLIYLAIINNDFNYLKGFEKIIKYFISLISNSIEYSLILQQQFLYSIFPFFKFTLKDDNRIKKYCEEIGVNYFDYMLDLFFKYNWKKYFYNDRSNNKRIDFINYKFSFLKNNLSYFKEIDYYKNILKNIKINNYWDFKKILFLDKNIYRENTQDNKKLFSFDKWAFIFSSWWTTSKPRNIYRDFDDIKDQYEYFKWLDLNSNDVVLNLFMPWIWWVFTTSNIALSYYNCKVIPLWWDNLNEWKLNLIFNISKKFDVNCLIWVPSTILRITKFFEDKWYNKISKIYCLWEKIYESIKEYFFNFYWNKLNIISIYWCMEAAWIWYQDSLVNWDKYKIFPYQFIEIIDSNWNVLDYWQEWEIVVTTLKKRLVPLLRFKTWDYWVLYKNNNDSEILKIIWRTDDLLISATVHIELSYIDKIIKDYKFNILFYQLYVYNRNKIDYITLKLEVANSDYYNNNHFEKKFKEIILQENYDLKEALLSKKIWDFKIEIYNENSLERNYLNWKIKRVFDFRK